MLHLFHTFLLVDMYLVSIPTPSLHTVILPVNEPTVFEGFA